MPNDKITPAIPGKIKKEYRLVSLLSLHENALVFSLEKRNASSKNIAYAVHPDPANGVMKIMPKPYFDEALFTALQSLHHPLLLLPTELIAEGDYVYALYPRLLPFSEYLSEEKISLSTVLQWIKDMSQILSCLHDKIFFTVTLPPAIFTWMMMGIFIWEIFLPAESHLPIKVWLTEIKIRRLVPHFLFPPRQTPGRIFTVFSQSCPN